MRCRIPMTAFFLLAGFVFTPAISLGQTSNPNYKVLAQSEGGFNVSSIEALLEKADAAASKGNLTKARKLYDKSRVASKQLLAFYRDLGGAFRGLDARIPREMDAKGRKAQILLANINLRLAAHFRRQGQPEVAVPLLIEVVKLTNPNKPEGKKAYQSLLELGFVDTPYAAGR